ncbi:STAS domain-containing protein [Bacillus massilinigeriensis]|uniref:STAS domain-containing protein n=1 Tax=Bacillus mediterraneensis TaxID=1805474 RepID=UPI0008F8BA91|nr:STAS domain-containing protein [Bacillus mediterraneensis]
MDDRISKSIPGTQFSWDIKSGELIYEGAGATLFWIETTLKSIFETLEELTGSEEIKVVMQTAGFRTGKIVGEGVYSNDNIEEVVNELPHTYEVAGWGKIAIEELCLENKRIRLKLENTWETRLILAQVKEKPSRNRPSYFIPGHMAGVFTILFNENMWYKNLKCQSQGDDFCLLEIAPTRENPDQNIVQLLHSRQQMEILKLEAMVEDRTRELVGLIKDLSSPIIPIFNNTVVIPLIGKFDERRAGELTEKILDGIMKYKASYLLLDVTAINEIDEFTVSVLQNVTCAVRLLGASTFLVGVSPELSMQMVNNSFSFTEIKSFTTLQHGLMYTLAIEGLAIKSDAE